MSTSTSDLIHGYLDETLTAAQHAELANWIKASPEHARQFADIVLLHDRLRAEVCAGDVVESHSQVCARPRSLEHRRVRRVLALTIALCLTLVAGLIIWESVSSPVLAASAELERIIRASEVTRDRTYVVTALNRNVEPETPPDTGRGAKPSVDGALLHVRGPNQYVLVRFLADGTEFITGSNGTTAWSVPPRGRVRVSSDPTRFRGAVPGQQHAIPFVNMRDSLRQLQESYELDLSPGTTPEGWRRMNATRKSSAAGGPKQVTLWYDVQSGTIHRMLLERLPQARGGPRNVLLELTDERDLGPAYFEHTSHHDTNREVFQE